MFGFLSFWMKEGDLYSGCLTSSSGQAVSPAGGTGCYRLIACDGSEIHDLAVFIGSAHIPLGKIGLERENYDKLSGFFS